MNHKTIKYLKLPFQFEEEALLRDLQNISNEEWHPQIYTMNYEGNWNSVALMAKQGDNNTFAFAASSEEIKETILLQCCLYFKEVIKTFQCPLISVRLLRLEAGARIKPHKDFKLGYENNNFRIHIPISTNEKVEFVLGGERLKMLPGECWYTNVNFTHSVINRGNQDRIHLVLDGERNEWSDALFFSLAPKENFNVVELENTQSTNLRMIEELKHINAPGAKELIEKLKADMANNH